MNNKASSKGVKHQTTAQAEPSSVAATKAKLTKQPQQQQPQQQQKPASPASQINGVKSSKVAPQPSAAAAAAAAAAALAPRQNARMLDSFWKLSEYEASARLVGLNEITRYFATLSPLANKESFNYVLVRLIKGLASNRKCSRLGYSCALTELIARNPATLTYQHVFQLATSHLTYASKSPLAAQQQQTTKNKKNGHKQQQQQTEEEEEEEEEIDERLTKEEIRHMQIGLVFVYLCWIQSGRLFAPTLDTATIEQIVSDLNAKRKSDDFKPYIRQLYAQALVVLIKQLPSSDDDDDHKNQTTPFVRLVLPIIGPDLLSLWHTASLDKDNLNLLLACLNRYGASTRRHIAEAKLDYAAVMSRTSYARFLDILGQSSEHLPVLEPVCVELLAHLAAHETDMFRDMWLYHLDAKFYARREPEKKYLGYKLFVHSLGLVDATNEASVGYQTLLKCTNVTYTFVSNLTNKASVLQGACRELARELSAAIGGVVARTSPASTFGADLLIELIGCARNCHDVSDLVHAVAARLNEASLAKLVDYLCAQFLLDDEKTSRFDDANANGSVGKFIAKDTNSFFY